MQEEIHINYATNWFLFIVPKTLWDVSLLIIISVYRDSDKIYLNEQVGHMLRTKNATENEGGVAAGCGALDSPYLIDI